VVIGMVATATFAVVRLLDAISTDVDLHQRAWARLVRHAIHDHRVGPGSPLRFEFFAFAPTY